MTHEMEWSAPGLPRREELESSGTRTASMDWRLERYLGRTPFMELRASAGTGSLSYGTAREGSHCSWDIWSRVSSSVLICDSRTIRSYKGTTIRVCFGHKGVYTWHCPDIFKRRAHHLRQGMHLSGLLGTSSVIVQIVTGVPSSGPGTGGDSETRVCGSQGGRQTRVGMHVCLFGTLQCMVSVPCIKV